ncbi:hypothetical protein BY458DRAFT_500123 [Sporodiniella umbellata]|nr:hypothetical protein BY458DRAFT_500123 [Sporodiniella umbellata]
MVGLERLPFEIILEILQYVPFSTFRVLHSVFPSSILDEALVFKLRVDKSDPILKLISTNQEELCTEGNEKSIGMYYSHFDAERRLIWMLPNTCSFRHYFKIKTAYVSHGKLILCSLAKNKTKQQKALISLWDIRKALPHLRSEPSTSGPSQHFSGSSNFQELTINVPGCILDSCLVPVPETVTTGLETNSYGTHRSRIPLRNTRSSLAYPDPTCGVFLVERLGVSIPSILELF